MKWPLVLSYFVLHISLASLVQAQQKLTLAELQGTWGKPQLDPTRMTPAQLCSGGVVYVRFRRGKRVDFSDGQHGDECKVKKMQQPKPNVLVFDLNCAEMGERRVAAAKTARGVLFRGTFSKANFHLSRDEFVKDAKLFEKYYAVTSKICVSR